MGVIRLLGYEVRLSKAKVSAAQVTIGHDENYLDSIAISQILV